MATALRYHQPHVHSLRSRPHESDSMNLDDMNLDGVDFDDDNWEMGHNWAGDYNMDDDMSYLSRPAAFPNMAADEDPSNKRQTAIAPSPGLPLSYSSTPMSALSVSSECDSDGDVQFAVAAAEGDEFDFRSLHSYQYQHGLRLDTNPVLAPKTDDNDAYLDSDMSAGGLDGLEEPPPTPSTPSPPLDAGTRDDTAAQRNPSGRVDYLAHEWQQEDLWASYKYVTSRRDELPDGYRLENASWRSWSKKMNNLATVSAESLNWLKDCDTTWLYGPIIIDAPQEPVPTPAYTCAIDKRPILKKRSLSELMLLKSLSEASLLKDATAAVQAQTGMRPMVQRRTTADFFTSDPSLAAMTSDSMSLATSSTSSGIPSPSVERRRIQFNERVSQCIALEYDEQHDHNHNHDPENDASYFQCDDDDCSSDHAMVMKRTRNRRNTVSRPLAKRRRSSVRSRIIAMLPSTTLKAAAEPPPPPPPSSSLFSMADSFGAILSRTSSQETLRPSNPARSFLFDGGGGADDGYGMDGYDDWKMPDFSGDFGFENSGLAPSPASSEQPAGMRRTSSGMFMPIGEERPRDEGLIGRVMEAVNTAKDIGHVIWNVGWSGR